MENHRCRIKLKRLMVMRAISAAYSSCQFNVVMPLFVFQPDLFLNFVLNYVVLRCITICGYYLLKFFSLSQRQFPAQRCFF